MLEFKTIMKSGGRLIIPAKCRKALHLTPGETIIIRVEGEEATICSAKIAVERAQRIVTSLMKGKKGLVEELLKARKAEVKNE